MVSKILHFELFILILALSQPVFADASQITLYPEWNFISFPKNLEDGHNTGSIFNAVNLDNRSIFTYLAAEERWIQVHKDTTIEPLSGLWVYSKFVSTVPITYSTSTTVLPKQLVKGWNSFGISGVEQPASSALISIQPKWSMLIGYDSINQQYESVIVREGSGSHSDARTVSPGKGYWIYILDNCTYLPQLPQPLNNLTVSFIDVGQGDAILLISPNGKTMLIDAGPVTSASKVLSSLQNISVSSLDILIATHPHEDHIGGMEMILNSINVHQFIDIGYPHTTQLYENVLNLIEQKQIPYSTVKAGDIIAWDPAITIKVLNPQDEFADDLDDNSIVLKLTYGTIDFLFMGDAGTSVEDQIINNDIDSEILKVGHHGSAYGTSSNFVSHVTPEISIISVGANNPYGYPASETIQRLTNASSKIYRTDQVGTVTITTDGNTYQIWSERTVPIETTTQPTIIPTTIQTIVTTTIPTTEPTGSEVCDCSYDRYNCRDFNSSAAAQACYEYCISLGKGDVHYLDGDKDGLACEG